MPSLHVRMRCAVAEIAATIVYAEAERQVRSSRARSSEVDR
jgi:hypothetical protein